MTGPEERARAHIDRLLEPAGWHVCDFKAANIHAARGVAIREFPLNAGHDRNVVSVHTLCELIDELRDLRTDERGSAEAYERAHDFDIDSDRCWASQQLESIATPCSVNAHGR